MRSRSRLAGTALALGILPFVVTGCGSSESDPGVPGPAQATQGNENEPDENEPGENERGDNERDENGQGDG
jgi:hypothetical protein